MGLACFTVALPGVHRGNKVIFGSEFKLGTGLVLAMYGSLKFSGLTNLLFFKEVFHLGMISY